MAVASGQVQREAQLLLGRALTPLERGAHSRDVAPPGRGEDVVLGSPREEVIREIEEASVRGAAERGAFEAVDGVE